MKLRKTPIALMISAICGITYEAAWAAPADNSTERNPEKEVTLPTVLVKEQRQGVDTRDREEKGYQGDKTRVGKTPQLTKDIPQSTTIVSEQLIRERNADTFKEALRNVAGLTFNAGEGGRIGDNITLRGYSAVGDLFLDGVRDIAQYNRETFNLEQIDILRGSASMLFGRGSTGGIINQVSKTAKAVNRNEVGFTVGTDNYKRLTGDFNRMLTDNLAIRLNVMKTDTDSFRDGVSQSRWGFAPTLTWGMGTQNEVSLSYYHTKDDNVPDYGVPYFNGKPLNVPINRFYGMSQTDYERSETQIGTAQYTHRFDETSSLKTLIRKAHYERDLRAVAPRFGTLDATNTCRTGTPTSIKDDTVICRQRQARGGEEDTLTGQVDFNTQVNVAGMKHELLVGTEFLDEKANRWTNTSAIANPSTYVGLSNAVPILPANFDSSFSRTAPNSYTGMTYSAYAQDSIEFIKNWKLLLGARYDSMKADYTRSTGGDLSRRDGVWSTRAGLLYQPNKYHTYYVSYGTSFNPSAEAYQLDDRSTNTPPEKNRNIEIGAKWELLNGDLSVRSAAFRSEKSNERNTDLSIPDVYLLTGKRHTDGVELEAVGRINVRWEMFANVAVMKANIDEAAGSSAGNKDKVPVNTPNHTFSLWTTYKLGSWLDGKWKIGGGIEGVGRRYANAANTVALDSYQRVDGMLEYQAKYYSLKLNLFNLLDKQYYEGVYTGHTVPGTPLAAQLSITSKF